jgi:predicted DNA-binding antitoxin AbrB/MazE fold protein
MIAVTYEAVFEHGVFRLLTPLQTPLAEGQAVRIIVDPVQPESPEAILELATRVYDGFSQQDIAELEDMILDRSNFSKDRDLV